MKKSILNRILGSILAGLMIFTSFNLEFLSVQAEEGQVGLTIIEDGIEVVSLNEMFQEYSHVESDTEELIEALKSGDKESNKKETEGTDIVSPGALDVDTSEVSSLCVEDEKMLTTLSVNELDEFSSGRLLLGINSSVRGYGAVAATEIAIDGYVVLQYESAEDAKYAYDQYENNGAVDYVEVDELNVRAFDYASRNYNSWGYGERYPYYSGSYTDPYAINLNEFLENNSTRINNPVKVAVLDTGLTPANSLFTGRVDEAHCINFAVSDYGEANPKYSDPEVPVPETDYSDKDSHGTHVAGTIAEATPSFVQLMAVRVLNDKGAGYNSWLIEGIRYAAENGADVINMSLGGSGRSSAEDDAVEFAYKQGVVVCVAAGNENVDAANVTPAACPYTITVGATDTSGEIALYKSDGTAGSNWGDTVDVFAPGSMIMSTVQNGSIAGKSGTSMATPHVAAVAALVRSIFPDYGYEEILDFMTNIAQKSGYTQTSTISYSRGGRNYQQPRLILGDGLETGTIVGLNLNGPEEIAVGYTGKYYLDLVFSQEGTEKVQWSSSNTEVAVANANGVITGVKPGQVTITAKYSDDIIATKDITVKDYASVIKLSLPQENLALNTDYQIQVSAPSGGEIPALQWSVNDTSVGSVTQSGVVRVNSKGHLTVKASATIGNLTVEDEITVFNYLDCEYKIEGQNLSISWPDVDSNMNLRLYVEGRGFTRNPDGSKKYESLNGENAYRYIALDKNITSYVLNNAFTDNYEVTAFKLFVMTDEEIERYDSAFISEPDQVFGNIIDVRGSKFYQFTKRITYVMNGGRNNSSNKEVVSFRDVYGGPETSFCDYGLVLYNPTKTSATFEGWYYDSAFKKRLSPVSITGTTGSVEGYLLPYWQDITVYAKWSASTAKTYKVKFDPNGGAGSIKTINMSTGDVFSNLPVPTRKDYVFDGWYTSKTGGSKIYEGATFKETCDTTYYAHWAQGECTVSFDPAGGTVEVLTKKVTLGDVYGELPVPRKDSYTFLYWYYVTELGDEIYVDKDTRVISATDHTLKAKWNQAKYTVEPPYFVSGDLEQTETDGTLLVKKGSLVEILCDTDGAEIFYTVDSTDPKPEEYGLSNTSTQKYEDSIVIDGPITIKAIAKKDGFINSAIVIKNLGLRETSAQWGDVLEEDRSRFANADEVPESIWFGGNDINTVYTGKAITLPNLRVYKGKILLKEKVDYTIKYSNNVKAGTAKFTVKGKNNYSGTAYGEFTISKRDISQAEIEDVVLVPTGKQQRPKTTVAIVIDDKKYLLKENKDFIYEYEGNIVETGVYHVKVNGIGGYDNSKSFEVKVAESNQVLLSKVSVGKIGKIVWDGSPKIPELDISYKGTKLVINEDYEILADKSSITDVGKASLVLEGKGMYVGRKIVSYNISGIPLNKNMVALAKNAAAYTGEDLTPEIIVKAINEQGQEVQLAENVDYSVSGKTPRINAGTYSIVVKGQGKYTGKVAKSFKITPMLVENGQSQQVTVNVADSVAYQKGGAKPKVTVKNGETNLIEGTDYKVSYANNNKLSNADASKAPTVKVTLRGNYKGILSKNFSIVKKTMVDGENSVIVTASDVIYKNKSGICKPTITVVDTNGKALKAGSDYDKKVQYTYQMDTIVDVVKIIDGNKHVGKVLRAEGSVVDSNDIIPSGTWIKAQVTGKGNYDGTASGYFKFANASVAKATVSVKAQIYSGTKVQVSKDDISIKIGKNILGKNDYEIVGYKNNEKKGTGTITIRGKGSYGGTKTVKFTIKAGSL